MKALGRRLIELSRQLHFNKLFRPEASHCTVSQCTVRYGAPRRGITSSPIVYSKFTASSTDSLTTAKGRESKSSPINDRELSTAELTTLTSLLVAAAERNDLENFIRLSLTLPKTHGQCKHIAKAVECASAVSFALNLSQVKQEIIDRLQQKFTTDDFDKFLHIVNSTFWSAGHGPLHDAALDEIVTANYLQIQDASWCSYMQLKLQHGHPLPVKVGDIFFNDVLNNGFSYDSIITLSNLLREYPPENIEGLQLKTGWKKMIGTAFGRTLTMYFDSTSVSKAELEKIGELCGSMILLRNFEFNQHHVVRQLIAVIAQNMPHYGSGKYIPKHFQNSIQVAMSSMGPECVKDGVESVANMQAIMKKVCLARNGGYPALATFKAMVSSRHVSVSAADRFTQGAKEYNWDEFNDYLLSILLMSFGEFGAIKADLYSQILPAVLSGRYDDVTPTNINSLIFSLLGMAMVNIYPHALYHELFSARLDSVSYMIRKWLFFLDGNLVIMSPKYNGKRLQQKLEEKPERIYYEEKGKGYAHGKVLSSMASAVNTIPQVTQTYIAQIKPALPHLVNFEYPDSHLVLTSMSKSKPHVAIVALVKSDYLIIYHGNTGIGQSQKMTKRLIGLQSLKIKSLQKKGFKVLMIDSEEYASHGSMWFLTKKLKEINAI